MNSKRKGGIAIGAAIAYFSAKGYSVFSPINDCEKYDLIVDQNSIIKRVQVKFTSRKDNSQSYEVKLQTYGGYRDKVYETKYKKGDFDLLFVLCINGKKFLIPSEKVIGKKTVNVNGKTLLEYEVH